MHLGAIWELYGVDLGSIFAFSAPHSDKGTPALPRFAPRSVTISTSSVDDVKTIPRHQALLTSNLPRVFAARGAVEGAT